MVSHDFLCKVEIDTKNYAIWLFFHLKILGIAIGWFALTKFFIYFFIGCDVIVLDSHTIAFHNFIAFLLSYLILNAHEIFDSTWTSSKCNNKIYGKIDSSKLYFLHEIVVRSIFVESNDWLYLQSEGKLTYKRNVYIVNKISTKWPHCAYVTLFFVIREFFSSIEKPKRNKQVEIIQFDLKRLGLLETFQKKSKINGFNLLPNFWIEW